MDSKEQLDKKPAVVCFVGSSGSGKTTFLEQLIPALKNLGFKVATVKHHLGKLVLDQPGKDSFRHRKAGADASIIATPGEIGLVMSVDGDPGLDGLIPMVKCVDFVLCEGYRNTAYPKIEVFRRDLSRLPTCKGDDFLVALVTDSEEEWGIPRFSTHDPQGLARFLADHIESLRPD